jgi:hypothetical protein
MQQLPSLVKQTFLLPLERRKKLWLLVIFESERIDRVRAELLLLLSQSVLHKIHRVHIRRGQRGSVIILSTLLLFLSGHFKNGRVNELIDITHLVMCSSRTRCMR